MSEQVEVRFGDNPQEQATLLLAAAEDLGLDPGVVGTTEGSFVVPKEVHDKAFSGQNESESAPAGPDYPTESPEPEKKTAKKSTTRKKV